MQRLMKPGLSFSLRRSESAFWYSLHSEADRLIFSMWPFSSYALMAIIWS